MKMTAGGFKILRDAFGPLKQLQIDGINLIVDEIDKDKSISYPQAAYMLGTTWHETARTMQPIEEIGKGAGRKYGQKFDLDGSIYRGLDHIYYGRGYVQLTWLSNYLLARKKLDIDFVNYPELALKGEYAVKILISGMKEGWFTGRKLSDYIHQSKKDYVNARRIINGMDEAQRIANYAMIFEKALRSL
ncbi:hypothetical protein N5J48_04200 [Acinetobacter ursingii]|uniref:hypothetical protein n=1 Tax=Acinetobacter ursingii TaxID=108980 RepID=UPI00244A9D9B|nr:hypothetical protein [Acinetobacter ursingii]MDG9859373.1 hypothetical protein [Acinetobacter ursingii]MDG9894941.1 hypothetical protein [Acinetobacter ursingii]MDH0006633.1 hypothetical protein [Acinetobacter ursingii]MDH0478380.1 hypothetical protein [Acinetobacter ursingii]MDH2119003.1 hypothetical protein [Acinetobacter ursingii]